MSKGRRSPVLRSVTIVLAIACLSEILLCAPLHAAAHDLQTAACGSGPTGLNGHVHDEWCSRCPHRRPDDGDCDHCVGHHDRLIRGDRSPELGEVVAEAMLPTSSLSEDAGSAVPTAFERHEPSPRLLLTIRSTIILI